MLDGKVLTPSKREMIAKEIGINFPSGASILAAHGLHGSIEPPFVDGNISVPNLGIFGSLILGQG